MTGQSREGNDRHRPTVSIALQTLVSHCGNWPTTVWVRTISPTRTLTVGSFRGHPPFEEKSAFTSDPFKSFPIQNNSISLGVLSLPSFCLGCSGCGLTVWI